MTDRPPAPAAIGAGSAILVLAVLAVLAIRTAAERLHGVLHRPTPETVPLRPSLAVGGAVAILAMAIAVVTVLRIRATQRTLASRSSYLVLASDDFDPSPESVLRAAAQLARVRRAVLAWLDPRASAVRVRLDSGPGGRMLYRIQVARRARSVVRAAFSGLGDIELREEEPADDLAAQIPGDDVGAEGVGAPDHAQHVARAELILARPPSEPLALVGLNPDPLQLFARAFGSVHGERGESASVILDVLPATSAQRHRFRRLLLRGARDASGGSLLATFWNPGGGRPRDPESHSLSAQVERRAEARQLATKVLEHDPLFEAQILLRVESPSEGRARAHVESLLSCFDAWSGQNWFRVAGWNLLGLKFWGADDLPWLRWTFDRRFGSGLFRPSRRNLVTAREIGALLKPPTAHCDAHNVARLGGSIPPAPPGLPTFKHQPTLLPLGTIPDEGGKRRLVGVPLRDTFFSYMSGRARYGKTETAINQFLHLVRSGHGGLFLDPHDDAKEKIKAHLTERRFAERIQEISLAGGSDRRQIGWSQFSMRGRSLDDAEKKVAAVVDSFASALQWDDRASRAMNLITQAAQTNVELAFRLPPELAPNLFTIITLLTNDEWRKGILGSLSAHTRDFWIRRFPRLPAEAVTPITNLLDRMRASRSIAALFGTASGQYDIRRAMDEGKIVLACPGAGGLQQNRLVANLLVYDLLHAALTRVDTPPKQRRPFFAFVDEAQVCDGASNGNLAALLEQSAKFGVRLFLFNQDPERLTARTWSAIKTNRSHLMTTVVSAEAAVLLARQWGGDIHPATITRLPRFSYVASITLDREICRPFLVTGVPVAEMWADCHHPEKVPEVDALIDRLSGRRPVADVIAELDHHDQRILDYLRRSQGAVPGQSTTRGQTGHDRQSAGDGYVVGSRPPARPDDDVRRRRQEGGDR